MADDSTTLGKRRIRLRLVFAMGLLAFVTAVIYQVTSSLKSEPKFHIGKHLPPGKVQPQIVCGYMRAAFLAPDGSVWAWGQGYNGKTTRTLSVYGTPKRLGHAIDWRKIAIGEEELFGIKEDGTLWRCNLDSTLVGNPVIKTNFAELFERVGADSDWSEISVNGMHHVLALKQDGSLWAMGENKWGELGQGYIGSPITNLVQVLEGAKWKDASASFPRNYGLREDGTIWRWGVRPTTMFTTPEADATPAQISPDTNWVAIASGTLFVVALKSDNSLWIHGIYATLITEYTPSMDAESFSRIGSAKDWVEIVSSQSHILVKKRDGSWWSCGNDFYGQLGIGRATKGVSPLLQMLYPLELCSVVAGTGTTLIYAPDGKIWSFGARLGSPEISERKREFYTKANQLAEKIGLSPYYFSYRDYEYDVKPHLVWQWPPVNSP